MGACASKPKVLEGTAPHVAGEDIMNNNKQEGIVGDDVPNKPHSLSNLFEGKGSEQVKEETSKTIQTQPEVLPKTEDTPQAFLENTSEDVIESKIEKRVEEIKSEKEEEKVIKSETEMTPAQEEEVIKSEIETTPSQKDEVIKSETDKRVEEIKSETETTVEEIITSETEISTGKKVEETVETPAKEVTKAEKTTEEERSEAPVEEKPAKKPVIEEKKSGKFWWDK
ncbi:uncharacterized protein LOC129895599 [Solanum dulcamara]|uniref:uncharacterized protein LOC129895599 n=1 Tax=Solanum dulcamara TaxID=45834 RepID=UPI002486C752|nr:uncharacterized protein LOC129895599 [Solanum dulcamara]